MAGTSGFADARYIALASGGAPASTPILYGSNAVGDALLSSGLMALAGSTALPLLPMLPVRISGIDVHETLHRFDASAQPPTPERGVTGVNRVGEPVAQLTMRWLVAPDEFEATPSALPAETELVPLRSQRFVVPEGALRFQDRLGSGIRFFGAGRTYPTLVDGTPRLLFAGAAVVLEGLGGLKGLRGTLTLSGEISARALVSLVVVGRFDGDGPLESAAKTGAMGASGGPEPDATVLMIAGEAIGGALPSGEHLCSVRIDTEFGNSGRPSASFQSGVSLGSAVGPMRFDPSDRRFAVRLIEARRELTIAGEDGGRPIATIVADGLEGTAFPDRYAGHDASRVIAYGALSGGTGTFAGAGGVLTVDAAMSPDGASKSVYTLWLVDGRGRFRAQVPVDLVNVPADAAMDGETDRGLRFIETSATSILPSELATLTRAERTLADGHALLAWLQEHRRPTDFLERFAVSRDAATGDHAFGFFDTAATAGGVMPVMGVVQDIFYDSQKQGSPDATRGQLREFVLRYYLRVSRARDAAGPGGRGCEQLFFKRAGDGLIGKFTADERPAIADLRTLGGDYEWIVLRAMEGTFELPWAPIPAGLFQRSAASADLVIGPRFVASVDEPRPGVLLECGFGYAFVPPVADAAAEPFRAAVQTLTFTLMADGEIRARTELVVNRPEKIAAVSLDPIAWGVQLADLMTFRMASRLMSPVLAMTDRLPLRASGLDPVAASIRVANTLTGGLAASRLGLSKADLERRMLVHHLTTQRERLLESLQIWRMIPDWTAHGDLPDYCQGTRC